jgi:hypothetical protein
MRMPQASTGTVKRPGLLKRDFRQWFDEREEAFVRFVAVKLKGLVADRVAPPAFHPMAVIIEYFFEWTEINHCLISLKTRTLLAFECLHGHGAKFNALDCSPRLFFALKNLNPVEARVGKGFQKTVFGERA